MYSRYGDDPRRPIRLPEHYGGSAFAANRGEAPLVRKGEPTRSISREGGEKISPTADRFMRVEKNDCSAAALPEAAQPSDPAGEAAVQNPAETAAPSPERTHIPAGLSFEGLRRLFGGIGEGEEQDRLLLLGLILLLSRTGGDSDVLLWLSLLLLCG